MGLQPFFRCVTARESATLGSLGFTRACLGGTVLRGATVSTESIAAFVSAIIALRGPPCDA